MLLLVVFLAPIVWGLVDAVRRPKEAFEAAGQKRGLWIGLLLVALLAPPIIGAAVAVWYLIAVRRKVAAAMPSTAPPADER
jgi:hypothetical protein